MIDDESAGKCPFDQPIRSGVGRHRVVAQRAGKEPISKNVEVVAGETAALVMTAESETPEANGNGTPVPKTETHAASTDDGGSRGTWLTIGWITTGVLAAGAIAVGANALVESNRLEESRKDYPGNKSEIHTHARRTGQYALIADVLGAAAVVTGGITLYFSVSGGKSETQVGVGPGNVRLIGRF